MSQSRAVEPGAEGAPIGPLGVSPWYEVRQPIVDAFGAVTEDLEPLHNDPEWCRNNSPYETPIAYGFLTLSLLTKWLHEVTDGRWSGALDKTSYPINYGIDRLRLLAPVKVGQRVRAHIELTRCVRHKTGHLLHTFEFRVEIEGSDRPALITDWLLLWVEGTE
jgi:acyl dehydratase